MLATLAGDVASATLRRYPGVHVQQATVLSFDPRLGRADLVADGPNGGTQISQVDVASQQVETGWRVWVVIWPPHSPLVVGRVGGEDGAGCGLPGPHPVDAELVASGDFSCAEGFGSEAIGNISFAMGSGNVTRGGKSICAGGDTNETEAAYCATLGGENNVAGGPGETGEHAAVVGGHVNLATGDKAAVVGGDTNEASGPESAVVGGDTNVASGELAVVVSGTGNTAASDRTAVMAGSANTIDNASNADSAIVAGSGNGIAATTEAAAILAGTGNNLSDSANGSVIAGGDTNTVENGQRTLMAGSGNYSAADDGLVAGGGHIVRTGAAGAAAVGANHVVAESVPNAMVMGEGAAAYIDHQLAHANSTALDPDTIGGLDRTISQYQRAPSWAVAHLASTYVAVWGLDDRPYMIEFSGRVLARSNAGDVCAAWEFEAVVCADGAGAWRMPYSAATLLFADAGAAAWTATPTLNTGVPAFYVEVSPAAYASDLIVGARLHSVEVAGGV
jgi:hypothetical protein